MNTRKWKSWSVEWKDHNGISHSAGRHDNGLVWIGEYILTVRTIDTLLRRFRKEKLDA